MIKKEFNSNMFRDFESDVSEKQDDLRQCATDYIKLLDEIEAVQFRLYNMLDALRCWRGSEEYACLKRLHEQLINHVQTIELNWEHHTSE